MRMLVFYLSHELVQVLSHMGKNNGNPDLVSEKSTVPKTHVLAQSKTIWFVKPAESILTLVVLNPFFENTVDPDQMASDKTI